MTAPEPTAMAIDKHGLPTTPVLKRTLGLPLLVLYGLGVTVGAGIYVLVGSAAGRAGVHAPIAFLVAAIVMAFTAASFAELAVRFPVSASEAAYVAAGLRSDRLALIVGLLVVSAGVISAAAISRGAAGYIGVLVPASPVVLVSVVVIAMGAIAAWGITQAVGLAAIMTVIEIAGLLVIVVAGFWQQPQWLADLPLAVEGLGTAAPWPSIMAASLLAFFAFVGFEGVVNVAEEVKQPARTLPLAILITLTITTALYIVVVWVIIRAVPPAELAATAAPLSLAYERLTGASPVLISLIAIIATINGVIVQMIMASRVVYGLACQGNLPAWLGRVNAITHTPLAATILVVAITLTLAVAFPIDWLAEMTSRAMLVIFAFVNLALFALKWRGEPAPPGIAMPIAIPVLGFLTCVALLIADLV